MIYHVLPEVEPFSEYAGGSLSRWTANVLRSDAARIICPSADASWGFARKRVLPLRGMQPYARLLKQRDFRLRISRRLPIVRWLMKSVLRRLRDGDVLYIHNRPEYVLALPPRNERKARYKVVLHMHNDHLANLTPAEAGRLDPDLAVFNSRYLAERGKVAVPGLRSTAVLANGADESCFYPAVYPGVARWNELLPPVVLYVGRMVPEKGVDVLVDAMRQLALEGSPLRARIVGGAGFGDSQSSAYFEELRATAPPNVEFVPYVSGTGLGEEFRQATIFCCPSVWEEPFGMVNVEAMASGLPVVASAVGGIPEIFAEGGGLLVERGSAAALLEALRTLEGDPSLRRRMAKEGLASFRKRFRWSVIAAEYQTLMLGMHTAPPRPELPGVEVLMGQVGLTGVASAG